MTLSNLKKQLSQKINGSNRERISSVRVEFQKNTKYNGLVLPKQQSTLPNQKNNKDASVYLQRSELSMVSQIDESIIALDNNADESKLDSVKIIGITGSKGKSTTAFIVHEYLKALGYKSILYSSIMIDSPVSYVNKNEASEVPLFSEETLLNIIEEAQSYDTDYIVLEINESAIAKGLSLGIPFSVRALTNILPRHNEEQYDMNEYVKLKKSFFQDIPNDEDCKCVFGLTDSLSRDEFNELLRLNDKQKVTYGTKYICELRNADYTNLDCLLYHMNSSIDGLDMKIRIKEKSYDFTTNVILPHNSLNFTCALAIIEALGLFDVSVFSQVIKNIVIPGREEIIKIGNRTVVIGLYLMPAVQNFKSFKDTLQINKIKVVVGAVGTGFSGWGKEFKSDKFVSKRGAARLYAMNYLLDKADYVYLTSSDNAGEDANDIALELQSYLNNQTPSAIIINREDAIRRAILDSEPNDLIYIAGRGNRRILCDTSNSIKLIQDKEVVLKLKKDLGL